LDWLRFWDYTAADWAGLQLLALIAAAIVAWWQVKEARRVREAQAQPFVIVDLEVERGDEIYLVISNIGGTIARDVRLKFDPELRSSLDSMPGLTPPRELKPLRDVIPNLPPGKRIAVLFDIFHQRDPAQFPDLYNVKARFYAAALKRHVDDDSVIDLGVYRDAIPESRRDVHDVHERLNELVGEIRKWTAPLSKGLLTTTREDEKRRVDEIRRRAEEPTDPER
jgi:hypothetical protein